MHIFDVPRLDLKAKNEAGLYLMVRISCSSKAEPIHDPNGLLYNYHQAKNHHLKLRANAMGDVELHPGRTIDRCRNSKAEKNGERRND